MISEDVFEYLCAPIKRVTSWIPGTVRAGAGGLRTAAAG